MQYDFLRDHHSFSETIAQIHIAKQYVFSLYEALRELFGPVYDDLRHNFILLCTFFLQVV